MSFPNQVNVQPAPAVEGDFASKNPRFVALVGQGGFVAGALGVTVGRFAWATYQAADNDNAPAVVNNFGSGAPTGFVHREQQALITQFLGETSMAVPTGMGVTLMSGGDFWVRNRGTTQAVPGNNVWANFADGSIAFANPGSASATGSIAASTFSATGYVAAGSNVLTVTAVSSGTIVNGATISGTGVVSGTQIVAQLSGTAGGVGTYAITPAEQTVGTPSAPVTISGTYGTFTAASALSGTFVLGGVLSGTGVVAGTTLTQFLTGTGGLGTYVVNNNTVVASTTISETLGFQTKFVAMSAGAVGELVKITDHLLG